MITEISDAVGESGRGFGRITASEVFGAEILVASTIPQHVFSTLPVGTIITVSPGTVPVLG